MKQLSGSIAKITYLPKSEGKAIEVSWADMEDVAAFDHFGFNKLAL